MLQFAVQLPWILRLERSLKIRWDTRLEQVRETYPTSLADFLDQVDTLRQADTTMRGLTEDEFLRGKERLRRAVRQAEDTANPETRSNSLDLLVLR